MENLVICPPPPPLHIIHERNPACALSSISIVLNTINTDSQTTQYGKLLVLPTTTDE